MTTSNKTHISYSELKDWAHCPHYRKKNWIEKVASFEGNEYTAFGTAIHDVCEKKLLRENIDEVKVFQIGFDEELQKLAEKNIVIYNVPFSDRRQKRYFLNNGGGENA